MEKKLTLFSDYGKFDTNTFIVAENDNLVIRISNELKAQVSYYAIIMKDRLTQKLLIKDNCFEIPKTFLRYGVIDIAIHSVLNSQVIKTFVCDKLIVKELRKHCYVIPEIEDLKNKLNESINTYNKRIKEMEQKIKLMNDIEGVGL